LNGLQARTTGAPWSMAALVFGGLSMAGLPVSAGFAWRWSLYHTLSPSHSVSTLLLLLAGAGVMIGVWRGLSAILARSQSPEDEEHVPESRLTATVVAVAIAACVGIGLFPQPLASLATRLAEMYTFCGW